jgi:DNA repair protein RadC
VKEYDEKTLEKRTVTNKRDVAAFCKQYLRDLPIENVVILALDSGNRINGMVAFEGDAGSCQVTPCTIFRFLLSTGARCFIIAHNHPGGTKEVSEADWEITKKLYRIGHDLGVDMQDHIVVCDENIISLRDMPRWPTK